MDLATLHGLLFGFDQYFGHRAVSRTNPYDFPPRILPLEVGIALKEIENISSILHIIEYKDRCEVWPLDQWRKSTSFQESLRGVASKALEERDRHYSLQETLFKRFGLRDINTIETISTAIEGGIIHPEHPLAVAFGIADIIREYTKHMKESQHDNGKMPETI